MNDARCPEPIDWEKLVAYWLGELADAEQAAVEEHYFACARCAARLQQLAGLASGIRAAVRNGALRAVITAPFLEAMRRQGMQVREYRVASGETVFCSLGVEDDAVVGRMQVALAGASRVDALGTLESESGRAQWRLEDVPFDAEANEVLTLPSAAALRKIGAHTVRVRLVAVDPAGERTLGEYTFAHAAS